MGTCLTGFFGTTALRELYEETGYGTGKAEQGNVQVEEVSSVLVKDPG